MIVQRSRRALKHRVRVFHHSSTSMTQTEELKQRRLEDTASQVELIPNNAYSNWLNFVFLGAWGHYAIGLHQLAMGYCTVLNNTTAGCGEPIPPSRGSIDNFQSAADGATITYHCSPGLVPRTQMSAVCTNMIWRPDPATLQCREPLPGELGDYFLW